MNTPNLNQPRQNLPPQKKPSKAGRAAAGVFGGLLLGIGGAYVAKYLGYLPNFTIFHPATLALPLLVPMLIWMFARGRNTVSTFFCAASLYIMAACHSKLMFLWKFFVPGMMILLGLVIFSHSKVFRYRRVVDSETGVMLHYPVFSATLGRKTFTHTDTAPLPGAIVKATAGGVFVDLSQANIEDGAVIEITAVSGTADVKLPSYCNVNIRALPILGVVRNNASSVVHHNAPTVNLFCKAILGSVEVQK